MERGFVAQFERAVLFRIARLVAFSICFLLFVSLVLGASYLVVAGKGKVERPNAAQVVESIKPPPAVAADTSAPTREATTESAAPSTLTTSALHGVKLPPALQEMFLTEENQTILKNWLDELPDEERQPFIDGLAEAISQSRKAGLDDDAKAVNAFHERYASYVTEKQAAELVAKTQRLYVAGAVVSILMLLALFSLVLVLLAIERNTRVVPAGASA